MFNKENVPEAAVQEGVCILTLPEREEGTLRSFINTASVGVGRWGHLHGRRGSGIGKNELHIHGKNKEVNVRHPSRSSRNKTFEDKRRPEICG